MAGKSSGWGPTFFTLNLTSLSINSFSADFPNMMKNKMRRQRVTNSLVTIRNMVGPFFSKNIFGVFHQKYPTRRHRSPEQTKQIIGLLTLGGISLTLMCSVTIFVSLFSDQ